MCIARLRSSSTARYVCVMITALAASAYAGEYRFTKIADNSHPDFPFFLNAGPAMNNDGLVSFIGCVIDNCAVYTGDGTSLHHIADLGIGNIGQRTSINDSGMVTFRTRGSLFVGGGGPLTTIASEGVFFTAAVRGNDK